MAFFCMKGKRHDMAALHKLKKNYEFKKVYNEGKYYVEKYVVMYMIANNYAFNRVGFSDNTKLGFDIVFTARAGSGSADYSMIEKNIISILKRAKLKKSEE